MPLPITPPTMTSNVLDVMERMTNYQNALLNQGIQHQYAPQMADVALQKGLLTNQYLPAGYNIKAQNALNGMQRNNPANQFLRSLASFSPQERAIFMANPSNANAVSRALQQLQGRMDQGNTNSPTINSLLGAPPPMSSAGMGSGYDGPPPMPSQGGQTGPVDPGDATGFALNPRDMSNISRMVQSGPPTPDMNPQNGGAPIDVNAPPAVVQYQPNRSYNDRVQDLRTLNVSKQLVHPTQLARANAAVSFEQWAAQNQQQYSERMKNAALYAGAVGKGKQYMDQMNKKTPQAFTDYTWFQTEFVPNFVNNIKLMDKLSSSNKQRDELHGMIDYVNNFASNPTAAIKNINNAMKTANQIASSVYSGAEPIQKGIYRRAYDIPPMQGDYIQGGMSSAPAKISSPRGGGSSMVKIIDPAGVAHSISQDKVNAFLAEPIAKGWKLSNG